MLSISLVTSLILAGGVSVHSDRFALEMIPSGDMNAMESSARDGIDMESPMILDPWDITMTNSNDGDWFIYDYVDWGGFATSGCTGTDDFCLETYNFPSASLSLSDSDYYPASKWYCCYLSGEGDEFVGLDPATMEFVDEDYDSVYRYYDFVFTPEMFGHAAFFPDPQGCGGPSLTAVSDVSAEAYNNIIWKVNGNDPNYTGTLEIEVRAFVYGEDEIVDNTPGTNESYAQYIYEIAYNEPPATDLTTVACTSGSSVNKYFAKYSGSNQGAHLLKDDSRIRTDEVDDFAYWSFPATYGNWYSITGSGGICQDTEFSLGIRYILESMGGLQMNGVGMYNRMGLHIRISETGVTCP